MDFGKVGTADTIGKGIIGVEFLVTGRRILCEDAYIHLVILYFTGSHMLEESSGGVLVISCGIISNDNDGIGTGGLRRKTQGGILDGRFFIEGLRTDQLKLWGTDIAVSQIVSIILIVVGVIFLFFGRAKLGKAEVSAVTPEVKEEALEEAKTEEE